MPRPTSHARADQYVAIRGESYKAGEHNDCAVVAVAAVTGAPYAEVLALMTALGRRARRGTPMDVTDAACRALGFRLMPVHSGEMIAKYPGKAAFGHKTVTTHHPDRYNKVWADGHKYLFRTSGHILAVINGVNVDWTRGSARPVRAIYRIVKA